MEMPLRLPASTSIVFDTNVLVSAFVFKKTPGEVYLHCAERFLLYSSQWMLDELAEVLKRKKFKLPSSIQEGILDQVQSDVKIVYPTNDLPTDSRDPDDNNVLQVTLFVKANFLITGDPDLLDLGQVDTTQIISSRMFFDRYIA